MDRSDSAFALITALVAVAAVFAGAMSLAVISRAGVVESGALSRSIEEELSARSVASLVMAGIVGESLSGGSDLSTDDAGAADGPRVNTDELPEMPEFLREFLDGALDDTEPVTESGDAGGGARRVRKQQDRVRTLRTRGLPVRPVRVEFGGAAYVVTLTDGLGYINLNRADAEELASVFEAAGADAYLASRLAAQLEDYRDADDFVSPRGAENSDYIRRGLSIRNAPLDAVEELLFLPAMTPEVYRAVRPLVTVAGDGKLHALSSPEAVIAALPGMGDGAARAIVSLREAGTLDAESLKDALPLFGGELVSRFRFEPSPVVRVGVSPVAGGPRFTGIAVVTEDGVVWASFEQE